MNDEIILKKR